MAAAAKDVASRTAKPERELRREVEIRDAANAVGTEQPRH
jgi:hypothetical protein